jgi:YVTN family beta-propeller protein
MIMHYRFSLAGLIGKAGLAVLLAASFGIAESAAVEPSIDTLTLRLVKDYPLPGRARRWDYMSLDPTSGRLFIAHLGDSEIVVFDTKSKAVVGTIKGIGEVHGTLVIPELGRVYASATKTNEVVVIDLRTLKIVARIRSGVHPDGMAYAPDVRKLYVSDEHGKTETVIDVQTNKPVATIPLGGSVGNTQYDPVTKRIFVNVQVTKELVEIDPRSDTVVSRTKLDGADGNHGLLIAPDLRLAFIACEGNDKLLVMDMRTRKILRQFELGHRPDVLAYDSRLALLYVASESGVVSQFSVSANNITKIGEGMVGQNAHTLAIDPITHDAYFPINVDGIQPVLRVMRPFP